MAKMMKFGAVIFGRYEIIDLISEGGQTSVAKGLNQQTGQEVAIKQLGLVPGNKGFDEELARLKRASQLRFQDPNVCDPIEFGEEDGEWYLVVDFVEGVNLATYLLSHGGKLPVDEAVRIAVESGKGLITLHNNGIIHRDIKPENVMVRPDSSIVLIDLGICRNIHEQTITQPGGVLGSLRNMSPEQLEDPRKADGRSDLYSLGVVYYQALTGLSPVHGHDIASIVLSICQNIPQAPRQLDPSIPEHVDQACMRLLAKQPEARFQTAEEFIQAICGQALSPAPTTQASFCTSCGGHLSTAVNYCLVCGAAQIQGPDMTVHCLACGNPAGDAAICPNCNRPFSTADHRLYFITGSLSGRIFRIPEGIYLIGRDELSPRDSHISRRHLFVACANGTVFVQDAGSANQTYVGSRPADISTQLTPGQQLCIAGNTATYATN